MCRVPMAQSCVLLLDGRVAQVSRSKMYSPFFLYRSSTNYGCPWSRGVRDPGCRHSSLDSVLSITAPSKHHLYSAGMPPRRGGSRKTRDLGHPALELDAERFWTFDERQAKLARAVGLKS